MLCNIVRASARSNRSAVAPFIQCRRGHGHHHVDYSHLERPVITPESYSSIVPDPYSAYEVQPETIKKNWAWLQEPEYKPEALWALQFVNSKTVLGCLAEFNGTEFHHPLKGAALVEVYKAQLSHFETVTKAELKKEGVSKYIIDKLHEVYHTRAFVDAWEVDAAIQRFAFLGGEKSTYRVTNSGANHWPLWKSLVPVPFLNSWLARPEYRSSEATLGRHALDNEEAALINVRQFRGVVAFMNAVDRGLTDEERSKVKAVLAQGNFIVRLSDSVKSSLDDAIADITKLSEQDPTAAEKRLEKLFKAYKVGSYERLYLRQKSAPLTTKRGLQAVIDAHTEAETEREDLHEGVHYWKNEADRKTHVDSLRSSFLGNLTSEVKRVLDSSAGEQEKTFVQRFKDAAETLLAPGTHEDLQIMALLKSSELTDRQQDEILSIFRTNSDNSDDALLLDALNPHPVAKRLWGERIRVLNEDAVEYKKNFVEGADTTWFREGHYEKGTEEALTDPAFNAPPLPPSPFNTAMDEVHHMKLIRLATDFYGMDLQSYIGMATWDHLVHTYDISPGEETLDRTHPSPPDAHTYEELPIIKFDGWEEADEPADFEGGEEAAAKEVAHSGHH